MKTANERAAGDFYFALPRLANRMRGRSAHVSENNAVEAYAGSIVLFAVSFLFALGFFAEKFSGWRMIVITILLVFAVWIFWLLIFYANSLVIKFLRACGLLSQTRKRHAQDIFIGIVVAALAWRLSILHSWIRWVGIICLCALAANLAAALLLKLSRERR